MRLFMGVAGWLAMAFAGPGLARDEETYDLRGPAPQKGHVYNADGFFTIKDGNTVIKLGGQMVKSRITEKTTSITEVKVLAVDGRQVSRCRTRIVKDVTDTKDDDGESESETSPLQGETIISEWTGPRKWKHSLVDTRPSDEQKKKLDDMTGPDNDDALYPAGKVAVGHAWTTDAAGLVNFFDASFSDIQGEIKMKFVKIEDVDGDACAVIEGSGTVTAKATVDDGKLDTKVVLKRTVWRSLKTGVDLKDTATGTIKFSGKLNVDGMDAEFLLEGPFEAQGTTKVK